METMEMRRIVWAVCLLLTAVAGLGQALESVPKAEYRARRVALGGRVRGGVAVLFAGEEPLLDFMPFRQDADFYYLTGWTEPGAALVVIGPGPATTVARLGTEVPAHTYREVLFLPERDLVMEKYTGAKMDAKTSGVAAMTGVDEVLPMSALPAVLTDFLKVDRIGRGRYVWTQGNVAAANATKTLLAAIFGQTTPPPDNDVSTLTTQLREVKSPAEIALLRKASDASINGQLAGMRTIRPGVRERTVGAIELEKMMEEGCERPSYAPIVGSGPNATTLHYAANSRVMEKGDVVVIDEAGEYSMYASDITRTMPVDGHFTPRQREIYEVVLGAQRAAAAAFVAGKMRLGNVNQRGPEVTDTLDKVAYDYINTHGKDLHGEPLGKYFLHGLGHSVGIDVHDPYDPKAPIDKGWVFTIEPGVYIPEEQIGVRIEDVFYVDEHGALVDLIAKLPHEPADIESAMRH